MDGKIEFPDLFQEIGGQGDGTAGVVVGRSGASARELGRLCRGYRIQL